MKYIRNYTAALVLLVTILACSKFEKVTTQQYNKENVAFAHLSNWKVTEDNTSVTEGVESRFVSVEGSDNAVLMLTRLSASAPATLEEYVQILHDSLNEGAKDLTGGYEVVKLGAANTSPISTQIGRISRQGLLREFDVKALDVPVPHRAEQYLVETDKDKWFVVAQASKEDWDGVKEGFKTIFDSLSFRTVGAVQALRKNLENKKSESRHSRFFYLNISLVRHIIRNVSDYRKFICFTLESFYCRNNCHYEKSETNNRYNKSH